MFAGFSSLRPPDRNAPDPLQNPNNGNLCQSPSPQPVGSHRNPIPRVPAKCEGVPGETRGARVRAPSGGGRAALRQSEGEQGRVSSRDCEIRAQVMGRPSQIDVDDKSPDMIRNLLQETRAAAASMTRASPAKTLAISRVWSNQPLNGHRHCLRPSYFPKHNHDINVHEVRLCSASCMIDMG